MPKFLPVLPQPQQDRLEPLVEGDGQVLGSPSASSCKATHDGEERHAHETCPGSIGAPNDLAIVRGASARGRVKCEQVAGRNRQEELGDYH